VPSQAQLVAVQPSPALVQRGVGCVSTPPLVMARHSPSFAPVLAFKQEAHTSGHEFSQHTASTQALDWHAPLAPQPMPLSYLATQVLFQQKFVVTAQLVLL